MARSAGGGDPERESFRQPHVSKARRGADQRIAVGRVAYGTVEVVLQSCVLRRRDPVNHRKVFGFDSIQIELEQIGSERFRHIVCEPGRSPSLVRAKYPPAALLAHIPLGVRVPKHRMLAVGPPPFDQLLIRVSDNVLVLHRYRRHLDTQQPRGALCMVPGRHNDMLGPAFESFLSGDEIAALFGHATAANDPFGTRPFERIGLPLPMQCDSPLSGPLRHRLGDVGRVDVAVRRVEKRADEIVGAHERISFGYFRRRKPFVRDAYGLGCRRIEHVLVHALLRLRHPQVAHHVESGIEAGLRLQGLVVFDRVIVDVAGRITHVEQGKQSGSVPRGPGRKFVALDQHDFRPAGSRQMVCDRNADGSAADHKRSRMFGHVLASFIRFDSSLRAADLARSS